MITCKLDLGYFLFLFICFFVNISD